MTGLCCSHTPRGPKAARPPLPRGAQLCHTLPQPPLPRHLSAPHSTTHSRLPFPVNAHTEVDMLLTTNNNNRLMVLFLCFFSSYLCLDLYNRISLYVVIILHLSTPISTSTFLLAHPPCHSHSTSSLYLPPPPPTLHMPVHFHSSL